MILTFNKIIDKLILFCYKLVRCSLTQKGMISMDEKKKERILRRAQAVSFKALLAGYAGKGKKDPRLTTTTSMFGFTKTNTYRYGDFTVIDEWTTTDHSDFSFGKTMILFEEIPIWFMTYSGSYPKKVIPFLKEVLSIQYNSGDFRGGRGPGFFKSSNGDLVYRNNAYANGNSNFSRFSGREEIINTESKEVVGFHEYSGRSML